MTSYQIELKLNKMSLKQILKSNNIMSQYEIKK